MPTCKKKKAVLITESLAFHFPFISADGMPLISQTEWRSSCPRQAAHILIGVLEAGMSILGINPATFFLLSANTMLEKGCIINLFSALL